MHLNELKALHVSEVLKQAEELEIENTGRMRKQELMFAIIKKRAKTGEQIIADGVLEILPDGFGFLRSPDTSFTASTDDIYISPSQVRRFNLHTGDMIEGEVRTPKDGERYFALNKLDSVNGGPPEQNKHKVMFENLTPLFPKEQMKLERDFKGEENITGRIIDIIAPIGRGQRALIVAPPKSGKTVMMQHIAHAITANNPDVHLMVLLVDERPEEVTEMQRTVKGEIIASTFDEPAARHVHVAEMVIERAKRLVELKKDVVILLDSITRLARAYNNVVPSSGKVLSGGVDAAARRGQPGGLHRDHATGHARQCQRRCGRHDPGGSHDVPEGAPHLHAAAQRHHRLDRDGAAPCAQSRRALGSLAPGGRRRLRRHAPRRCAHHPHRGGAHDRESGHRRAALRLRRGNTRSGAAHRPHHERLHAGPGAGDCHLLWPGPRRPADKPYKV